MKFDFQIDSRLKKRLVIASLIIALAVIFLPMLLDHYKAVFEGNNFIPQPPYTSSLLEEKVVTLMSNSTKESNSTKTSLISRLFFKIFPKKPSDTVEIKQELPNSDIASSKSLSSLTSTPLKSDGTMVTDQSTVSDSKSNIIVNTTIQKKPSVNTKNNIQTISTYNSNNSKQVNELPKSISASNYNLKVQPKLFYPSIRTSTAFSEDVTGFDNVKGDQFQLRQAKTYNRGWILQLGSFAQDNYAVQLVKKLRANSFTAFISYHRNYNDKLFYRVYVGPFSQIDDAKNAQNTLKQKLQLSSIIVAFNPLDIT